jgi:hypothetical protein
MLRRIVATGALLLAASVWTGCALLMSASKLATTASESVSKSLGSASDSFTASDTARLEREYRDDVRVATRQWLETGESSDAFLRELGRIAELHGISHWEAEPGSLIAIGAGACEAGANESELSGIVASLGHERAESQALAVEGCRTAEL